jgi:hypothetical protein
MASPEMRTRARKTCVEEAISVAVLICSRREGLESLRKK